MQRIPEQYPISGGVQRSYLRSLDRMLQVASAHFAGLSNEYSPETKAFGAANQWDWERLPHHPTTYRTFAQLTDRVRQEYRWFDWIDDAAHPSDNRGFFEELGISAVSGMPWGFSFIELARLKEKVAECREKIPAPDVLVQDLRAALLYDETPIDAVSAKTLAIHRHAMRRNYLEQLEQAQLLHCGAHTFSTPLTAVRQIPLGGEDLWSISFLRYRMDTGLFEAYVIDAWQDARGRVIIPREGNVGTASPALREALNFAPDNVAWFMLHSLDEAFETLHPVHVSRLLIGPCENQYRTKPGALLSLPGLPDILAQNADLNILRLSRQYAYAPNHYESTDGKLRQVLHHDFWSDEFIVCPAKIAARLASAVAGTHVRVLEVSE